MKIIISLMLVSFLVGCGSSAIKRNPGECVENVSYSRKHKVLKDMEEEVLLKELGTNQTRKVPNTKNWRTIACE